jgi:hypothetical protein
MEISKLRSRCIGLARPTTTFRHCARFDDRRPAGVPRTVSEMSDAFFFKARRACASEEQNFSTAVARELLRRRRRLLT